MPNIEGGMADISTAYRIADERTYRVKIDKIEQTKTKKDKLAMLVVTTVIQDDDDAVRGIQMNTYCVLEKSAEKGGGRNEAGLRTFKKIVEQTLGEDAANDPDFDTDELVGWEGEALVKVEDYEDPTEPDPERKNKQRNYVARYFPK
jgi:hypothetical protein